MVVVGTGGVGTKIIHDKWPIESGLIAGTTKQKGRKPDVKDNTESTVLEEEFEGVA